MRPHYALVTGCLAACNALSGVSSLAIDEDAGVPLATEAGAQDGAAAETSLDIGIPDPPEDSATPPDDAADAVAPLDADASVARRLVFVTSTTTAGTFGSVTAGDNLCQLRANAAGHPGKFVAWLSRGGTDASSRVTSAGPWYFVNGDLAVSSPGQLRSAVGLTRAINRDEHGALISGEAWTGSNNGTYSGYSCTAWTLDSGSGTFGSVTATSALWQNQSRSVCTTLRHLYCFQN